MSMHFLRLWTFLFNPFTKYSFAYEYFWLIFFLSPISGWFYCCIHLLHSLVEKRYSTYVVYVSCFVLYQLFVYCFCYFIFLSCFYVFLFLALKYNCCLDGERIMMHWDMHGDILCTEILYIGICKMILWWRIHFFCTWKVVIKVKLFISHSMVFGKYSFKT